MLESRHLSAPAKLTGVALLEHAATDRAEVWPALERLATLTSTSRSTVIRALAELATAGAIRVLQTPGRVNRYELIGDWSECRPVPDGHQCQPDTRSTEISHPFHPDTRVVSQAHGTRFTLTPEVVKEAVQEADQESTPRAAKPRRSKAPKEPINGAAHQKVVDTYFAEFERVRGIKPLFDGADASAVKRLLAKCKGDADAACTIVVRAFSSFRRDNVTMRDISAKPDAFRGAGAAPPRGQQRPVQVGAVNDSTAEAKARAEALMGGAE